MTEHFREARTFLKSPTDYSSVSLTWSTNTSCVCRGHNMRGTNHLHPSSGSRRYLTVGSSAQCTTAVNSHLSLSRFLRIARKAPLIAYMHDSGPKTVWELGQLHVVSLLDSTFNYTTATCIIVAGFSAPWLTALRYIHTLLSWFQVLIPKVTSTVVGRVHVSMTWKQDSRVNASFTSSL